MYTEAEIVLIEYLMLVLQALAGEIELGIFSGVGTSDG